MRTKAKSKSKVHVRGCWEESSALWYEQTAVYCDACGMLIPKKRLVVRSGGNSRMFCGPDCAQLGEKVQQFKKPKPAS